MLSFLFWASFYLVPPQLLALWARWRLARGRSVDIAWLVGIILLGLALASPLVFGCLGVQLGFQPGSNVDAGWRTLAAAPLVVPTMILTSAALVRAVRSPPGSSVRRSAIRAAALFPMMGATATAALAQAMARAPRADRTEVLWSGAALATLILGWTLREVQAWYDLRRAIRAVEGSAAALSLEAWHLGLPLSREADGASDARDADDHKSAGSYREAPPASTERAFALSRQWHRTSLRWIAGVAGALSAALALAWFLPDLLPRMGIYAPGIGSPYGLIATEDAQVYVDEEGGLVRRMRGRSTRVDLSGCAAPGTYRGNVEPRYLYPDASRAVLDVSLSPGGGTCLVTFDGVPRAEWLQPPAEDHRSASTLDSEWWARGDRVYHLANRSSQPSSVDVFDTRSKEGVSFARDLPESWDSRSCAIGGRGDEVLIGCMKVRESELEVQRFDGKVWPPERRSIETFAVPPSSWQSFRSMRLRFSSDARYLALLQESPRGRHGERVPFNPEVSSLLLFGPGDELAQQSRQRRLSKSFPPGTVEVLELATGKHVAITPFVDGALFDVAFVDHGAAEPRLLVMESSYSLSHSTFGEPRPGRLSVFTVHGERLDSQMITSAWDLTVSERSLWHTANADGHSFAEVYEHTRAPASCYAETDLETPTPNEPR